MQHDERDTDMSVDWELLERYFAGDATPDESHRAVRLLAAHPTTAHALARVTTHPALAFDTDAQLARLKASIHAAPIPPARSVTHARSTSRGWRTAWRVAGVSAVLLALVLLAGPVRTALRGNAGVAGVGPLQEYVTPRGGRAMVRLTDGTRVMLGADSRLRYARSFGERDRMVWVDGDAYFDVAPSPARPFRVQAGPSSIRVLGTTFTVRARPDESSAEVVVESGSVSLGRADDESGQAQQAVTLVRGDLGRIGVSGTPTVQHNVDVASYTAWTAGKLAFRATPLAAVTHELERWYDIQIAVADPSAASVPVTMTFDDVSVDAALQRLSDALNMRYTRTGKSVRLTP